MPLQPNESRLPAQPTTIRLPGIPPPPPLATVGTVAANAPDRVSETLALLLES